MVGETFQKHLLLGLAGLRHRADSRVQGGGPGHGISKWLVLPYGKRIAFPVGLPFEVEQMDFLEELAKGLYQRRDQAVAVPFRDCSSTDFRPVMQDCHGNVDLWCRVRADHKPVRGWLMLESYPRQGVCRFVAHSVVVDEQGRLFDLTPSSAARKCPFLKEKMSEEEYLLMLSVRRLVHVDHRL
jgi:hypothetical protein